jgi:hypothetical protein
MAEASLRRRAAGWTPASTCGHDGVGNQGGKEAGEAPYRVLKLVEGSVAAEGQQGGGATYPDGAEAKAIELCAFRVCEVGMRRRLGLMWNPGLRGLYL